MTRVLLSEYSRSELIRIARALFEVESEMQPYLQKIMQDEAMLMTFEEYCEKVVDRLLELLKQ